MKSFASGPWTKPSQIVLGIDIGTTQSAVAFAFLHQGGPQAVHRVSQWPGQEAQKGESKIPSLVWYDSDKKAVSFGAEALSAQAEEDAEDHQWALAKHFKLHLHPSTMKAKHNLQTEPLPAGVPLNRIYTDFMRYILQHTQEFFESRILDGKTVWKTYRPTMEIVIAHPNGWGLKEQDFLRKAAVAADYASAKDAEMRIRFVTEAEASVHFCMFHADLDSRLSPGVNFVVCDAGGSTVDTTVYSVTGTSPLLQLKEKKASACVQAGAVFVDAAAEKYLRNAFVTAGLDTEDIDEYVKKGVKDFELGAKKAFKDVANDQSIDIAGNRFNNSALRVRRGRMTLGGSVVKFFFQQCVDEIIESVASQMSGLTAEHILLVGGFGDSPFLRQALTGHFGRLGCHVTIANDSTSKAVADGAVIWHAKLSVTSRVPRFTYGTEISVLHNATDPEHRGRSTARDPSGHDYISGRWSQIITRGEVMEAKAAIRRPYWWAYGTANPSLSSFSTTIYAFVTENTSATDWIFDKSGKLVKGFEEVCTVTADLSGLSGALVRKEGPDGAWWCLSCNIGIRFGGTELQAFIEWEENGQTCTGPVSLLPSGLM